MATKVYVLTQNGYEAYPAGVYTNEALANKAVEMGYGDGVIAFDLDEHETELRAGRALYNVGGETPSAVVGENWPTDEARPLTWQQHPRNVVQGNSIKDWGTEYRWCLSGTVEAASAS